MHAEIRRLDLRHEAGIISVYSDQAAETKVEGQDQRPQLGSFPGLHPQPLRCGVQISLLRLAHLKVMHRHVIRQ